jgi:hypothetical protein
MLFKTISASVYGIDAYPVEVEVDVGSAYMKDFNVVGLPDNAVKESRERIKSALRNCGFEFSYGQGVTINLAPADLRKEGSGFDLPMALGVVGCQGHFFWESTGPNDVPRRVVAGWQCAPSSGSTFGRDRGAREGAEGRGRARKQRAGGRGA